MGSGETCLSGAELALLIVGDLEPTRLASAQDHLDRCDRCRESLSALVRDASCTIGTLPQRDAIASGPVPVSGSFLGPGTWIGNYRVDRPIGAGAMGVVYEGVDRSLGRVVAIKLLNRTGEPRLDELDGVRMERESRALARLSHRNVVAVYQVGEHEGRRYLVMENVEGGTVRQWLAAAPRSVREILDVFVQVGHGLAAVHDAGFIHRDIKPDNLLIGTDGRVRVGDFGLVCAVGDGREAGGERGRAARRLALAENRAARLTETGALMGTPRYMAPEVLRAEPADARSDQWSYAASVWEALSGKTAYPGGLMTAILRGGEPRPPAEPEAARLPRRVRRALLRGLAHEPEARWPSVRALVSALEGRRARLTRRASTLLVAGAAVGIALGVALGGGRTAGPEPCAEVERALAGTWDRPRRAELARVLAAPPASYPDAAVQSVDRLLDRHADGWLAARRSACRAAERERAAGGTTLETTCLDERRVAFAAAVDELTRAPPADAAATLDAIAHLPATADCIDASWLASRPPLPAEPRLRAQAAELHAGLEAAHIRLRLGRRDPAGASAASLVKRARALGFAPLVAASLRLAGLSAHAGAAEEARAMIEQGLTIAEAAGDDVLVAHLWGDLLDLARTAERGGAGDAEVDRWLRHARAVATRLDRLARGAHDQTLAELVAAEGLLLRARGGQGAEARLREALELEMRGGDPDGPRVAQARARLASALRDRGAREEAAAELDRAERLARQLVGPAGAAALLAAP